MRCIASVSPEDNFFSLYDMNTFISKYANTPNPITKFFNKIDYVWLDEDHSKNIEWLEAMKKVAFYVEKIRIYSNDAEQLENLTDPNLHNTPISNLQLELKSFNFSSKTIENLKTIYPNLITLLCNPWNWDETAKQVLFLNFTKLLSNLDQTSLEMIFSKCDYRIYLEFRDVIFKVVESKEECSYIRAKSVEILCGDDILRWIE